MAGGPDPRDSIEKMRVTNARAVASARIRGTARRTDEWYPGMRRASPTARRSVSSRTAPTSAPASSRRSVAALAAPLP